MALSKDKQQHGKSPKQKEKKKQQEHLTEKDIEELMGMNRDRYTRKNGAVRRK
jgi:hypothetical protein